jgi:hypothetical protein
MSFRRAPARLFLALVVALGVIAWPPLAGPASAVEVLADGGFEATVPTTTTNPYWEGFDSEYPEGPLCRTDNYCNDGDDGLAAQRTGVGWLWFGFAEIAGQTGWAQQSVTIPQGHATLSYWYRFGVVSAPYDATLTVSLDGTPVATSVEPGTAQAGYVQQVADVSAWADGAAHVLRIEYVKATDGYTDATVDDVSLDVEPDVTPPPPPPTSTDVTPPDTSITSTVPGGVAKSLTVPVGFAASEGGATFTCSLDGAAFAACTSPAQLTVAPGHHVFRVVAKDAAGNADATPAEAAFTAYDCVTLKADVVHDRTKVGALKKKLRKARADLRAAVAADDADEAHRLQKKVHRLEKKRKAARKELKAARSAYAPCLQ